MRAKGFNSSLLLCEIKTHVPPAGRAPYRPPDVYQVSKDVVGAVAQVQKTAHKALRLVTCELHRRSIQDVEVVTFDELYERACFIVEAR